ncbi:MAG: hypothetical protein CMN87_03380 [Stappia sp.]|uniref:VIT1/CCC1 transporter family protein n=1 Tax=Stappia sp. TaxID=1870903 RepID=UPI000C3BCF71|nr:VIT family protein [Stappia sp.]MAB00544.1 hypothetical protein [Stappia sp.]MBM19034.1 hypothetical protein [Stappia sp.]
MAARAVSHPEFHSVERIGWLRAAVLGANDGLLSTASLVAGVAAAQATTSDVLIAGFAGLLAGAMSMATGEFVSVSSQADTEKADLALERRELEEDPEGELEELTGFYEARGVSRQTAEAVARELTAADALGAHAREELGITDITTARPLQAALTSAVTFAVGAASPLIVVLASPTAMLLPAIVVSTLFFLAILGALGARAGGANAARGALRVTVWGALALAVTSAAGALFGAAV